MSERTSRTASLKISWLVYCREMKDQLRDRRTVFTILVLPLVLYPLLGSLLLQVAQFSRKSDVSVCIIGAERLPSNLQLVDSDNSINKRIAVDSSGLQIVCQQSSQNGDSIIDSAATQWVEDKIFDVVIVLPSGQSLAENLSVADDEALSKAPEVRVLYNVASDSSTVAYGRVLDLLDKWQQLVISETMSSRGLDTGLLHPFHLKSIDIAPAATRDTAFWSKILPFIMLVWALTGAFYPAIDVVAGEKERGTLETLLCSPALRSEIVLGKLGAVTSFSVMTAVLNVVSMLITGTFVTRQFSGADGMETSMGCPPIAPMLWLFVALLPLSALFSALALAVSALARSSKEGQYYLMPLMMVALPLVMLPMLPGNGLSPGTALIPVTGMFLLARALVDGEYLSAFVHFPMVAGVTAGCLWLATRWAGRLFEDESVLFRGEDRWSVGTWMRHLWRDRELTASTGQAYGCAAIILVGLFFARLVSLEMPSDFTGITKLVLLPQLGLILAPTLLMSCVMTKSVRRSIGLRRPPFLSVPIAILMAFCLHPSYVGLSQLVQRFYPLSQQALSALEPFENLVNSAPLWQVILVLALVPAICEEVAFRGFIFSGLLQNKGHVRAILVSSLVFGFSHSVLQQSISATALGLLLGWITFRCGSILPALCVHLITNTLSVSLSRMAELNNGLVAAVYDAQSVTQYSATWTVVSVAISLTCIAYFSVTKTPYEHPDQETATLGLRPALNAR